MLKTMLVLALGMVQQEWYTFAPDGKNFRVELPRKPDSSSSRMVTSAAGQSQLTAAQLRMPDATYSIQVTENRGDVDPETFDDGIRRFAEGKKATLETITEVSIGPNSGREFEIVEPSINGPRRVKSRWIAAGKSLFMLTVAGSAGADLPPSADRFLGSLEIGGVKAAAIVREKPRVAAREKPAMAPREKPVAGAREKPAAAPRDRSDTADDGGAVADEADDGDEKSKTASSAPKATGRNSRIVVTRIPKNAKTYPAAELADLSRSFKTNRDAFRDVGPAGSVLVGVRVSYIEKGGGQKIRSVQPIYRSGRNHYGGRIYGELIAPVTTVVARPGYAIGGLVTQTGLTVDGFGIVFMKVDGERLDPNDTYNSPWIGDKHGGGPGEVMSQGEVVVGLQGRSGKEVFALGLIVLQ